MSSLEIVEDAVLLPVGLQDAAGVGRPEVLEVEQRAGEEFGGRRQVLLDEGVVALTAHPCMPVAQDLLGVGDHEQVDVIGPQTQALQGGTHILDAVHRQVDGARAAVLPAPELDGLAHGGVVDDGQRLGEVAGQDPVVEGLVAIVELVEEDVLVHVPPEVRAACLLVKGLDDGGEAADEAELAALLMGEGGAAVGQRVSEDGWLRTHGVSILAPALVGVPQV